MIPQAMQALPELMAFVQQMKTDYESHVFSSWDDFADGVRQWFTAERVQQVDDVVMGWKKMSSYADEQTLIHLTAALVSLFSLGEYQGLSPEQQNLALWIVLYHDVDKEAHHHKRDLSHGFRSAAVCGLGLARHGFVKGIDPDALEQWSSFTQGAIAFDSQHDSTIQVNSKLPDIYHGIDMLFGGRDSSVGLIICGVLLHMSLNVVDAFPQTAPLTNAAIQAYISPALFPLLRVMMLTDNKAWALFDTGRIAPEREQLYREFNRVWKLIQR